jgi:hypothetical protein
LDAASLSPDNDSDDSPDCVDPDDDNDNVLDVDDAFPFDPSESEDTDGDGLGDFSDECPLEDATGFDTDYNGCIDNLTEMKDIIATLLDEGVIDQTMKNSLMSKIETAEKAAGKENICAAINKLEALINQVNAQRGKKISDDAADEVTAYTNSIIAWFLEQLPEGESC